MEKNKIRMQILKILGIAFSIFFTIILVNTIFANLTIHINYKTPVMIVTTIILYLLCFGMYHVYQNKKVKESKFSMKPTTFILIAIGIYMIQLLLANLTYANCGWDCGLVISNALELYQGKSFNIDYFSVNPNNIALLLLSKYLFVFVGLFHQIASPFHIFVSIGFTILMIDLGVIFTILICRKLLGNKAAWFSLIFLVPLLLFSPYINVPYTDTITFVFPIAMFYCYLKIKEKTSLSILWIIAEGILATAGILLKPTTIIILIAIFLVELFYVKKPESIKKLILPGISTILLFTIGCSITYASYSFLKKKNIDSVITKEDFENKSISMSHFFMMGMQKTVTEEQVPGKNKIMFGAYRGEDADKTISIMGSKAKTEFNLTVAKERLQDFGILGYLNFLYQKANWILSDGTFYYGGEGNFFVTEPFNTSPMGKKLQQFTNIETPEYQKGTATIMQASWLFLILGLILSYTRKEQTQNNGKIVMYDKENLDKIKAIQIAKFAVIGIIAFNLLFEGRSRYLINHLSFFILVATYALKNNMQYMEHKLKLWQKKDH